MSTESFDPVKAAKQAMEDMGLDKDYAEGWRPKEGDSIVGVVTDIDTGYSEYNLLTYPIVTVERGDGSQVALHCFHDVLRKRILQLEPTLGETLGVLYKGKKPSKDGRREIAVYTVKVKGRGNKNPYASMKTPQPQAQPAIDPNPNKTIDDVSTSQADDPDDIPF